MRYTLVLLLVLVGCGFEPPNEQVFQPPAIYRTWFAAIERCSDHESNFDDITWIKADLGPGWLGHRDGNTVWIDRGYLESHRAVGHEILHVLINDHDHRSHLWTTCGVR